MEQSRSKRKRESRKDLEATLLAFDDQEIEDEAERLREYREYMENIQYFDFLHFLQAL